MRKVFFISCILLSSTSCSLVIKKIAGLKDPKVETHESVEAFLAKSSWPFNYNYVLKGNSDSATIINNIMYCFNSGIMLFDGSGIQHCYEGAEKCTGNQLEKIFKTHEIKNFYKPCEDSLKKQDLAELFSKLEPVDASMENQFSEKTDYYLVIYWSKFFGGKKRIQNNLQWITSLKENTSSGYNIDIILINTDLQEDWGLSKEKRLNLKFKFLGNKSGSLEFGKIPYR